MAKSLLTPGSLARELACDVDDVLLMLWDAGITYPTAAQSQIRPEDASRARTACGLASIKDRLLVSYWRSNLNMSHSELQTWALERGVALGNEARRLPKGALAKFDRVTDRQFARKAEVAADETQTAAPLKPFRWRNLGHSRDLLRHLEGAEIEGIHFQIAQDFQYTSDPIAPAGVRSQPLLDSAAGRSSTGMGGYLKYPTVEMAAAALMHSIVHNHPFYNGNKRTALVSMLAFLDENGLILISSQTEVFRWTVRVAAHKLGASTYDGNQSDVEVQLMTEWLVSKCRNVQAGERVITFAELRRRLQSFDCDVAMNGNRGGRAAISREITILKKGVLGTREKIVTHKYNMPYGGDGRQVSRNRIREMRQELQLTDEYGIDSASFYGNDKQPVDAFIAQYRKTLRRLARL
jgi:prophage maintenance system killer protein